MILTVISFSVIALRINEIESNPAGPDKDNEWIEIYSDSDIDLQGYYLENGDGETIELSGSFSGYKVVDLSGLWLDNSQERVSIKKDGLIIDETPLLDDSENKDTASSYCDDWSLVENTKGYANICEGSDEVELEDDDDETKNVESEEPIFTEEVTKKSNKIVLGNKMTNTITPEQANQYVSREFYIRTGVVYSFIIFLTLLVILLLVNGRNI